MYHNFTSKFLIRFFIHQLIIKGTEVKYINIYFILSNLIKLNKKYLSFELVEYISNIGAFIFIILSFKYS